jgi:hypothetical protein
MDVIKVASQIESKIRLLEKGRSELEPLAQKRAETLSEYDKQMAIAVLQLRNGKVVEIGGEMIKDPPVSIIERLAKGMCAEYAMEAELADAKYKLSVKKLDAVQAELNGWQSINRYLDASK